MTAPLVSIVIPNWNYARFLPEAVGSALAQTHAPVEIIVVDDGSTDGSVEVARRLPVRVVAQENHGVARARNRGAREARGDFLVFLDADDLLAPTFVARCKDALSRAPRGTGYAYTQAEKFGTQTGLLHTRPFSGRRLFTNGNFIPVTVLIRRSVFLGAGGFDPRWPAHEDHELWARLYVSGVSGVYVEEPLLRYRFHGPSRNKLSEREQDLLHARLLLSFPDRGLGWIARHPRATLAAYREASTPVASGSRRGGE